MLLRQCVLAVLCMICFGCGDADARLPVYSPNKSGALRIDLGMQQLDTTEVHVFPVRNDTSASLRIGSYTTSCDCLVLEIAKQEIGFGEEVFARCTLNSRNSFSGNYAFQINLQDASDHAKHISLVLDVRFVANVPSWSLLEIVRSK